MSGRTKGIIYALVARKQTVLAEHTNTSGNFQQVTTVILQKLPDTDGKVSYDYDEDHSFHIVSMSGYVFLCMTPNDFPRRISYKFLEDVRERFRRTFGDSATNANAYSLNKSFGKVLREQMEYFTSNPEADKIRAVRGQIDEVKDLMVDNIDQVLQRGDKIEILVGKTEQLSEEAVTFKKSATTLRKKMWWKNCKITAIIVAVIVVLILILVFSLCGADFSKCGGGSHPSPTPTPTPTPAP
mmetsp:Transcript_18606/g.46921  ORF Transcript_18606/g.46921 Transcript_18606/m.46921 type:complete len:241 (-) Transcript_18606:1530-2252(-)